MGSDVLANILDIDILRTKGMYFGDQMFHSSNLQMFYMSKSEGLCPSVQIFTYF